MVKENPGEEPKTKLAEPAEEDLMTETFKVNYKGKEEEITIQELEWNKSARAMDDAVEEARQNGREDGGFRISTYHQFRTLYSIIKAPFPLNIKTIRKLPSRIGDGIFTRVQKLNGVGAVALKNSEPPLMQEKSSEKAEKPST